MLKHVFEFYGRINDRAVYIVHCLRTTGSFSTRLWDLEKVSQQRCICCGGVIK